jgi:hypothetical protein
VARNQVLDQVASPELAAYFIWEPVLGDDDESAARRATVLVPDSRARHYWAPSDSTAWAFQAALPLVDEFAWDVYLLYDRGIEWTGKNPPVPTYYMHQLVGRLPQGRMLDGPVLREKVLASVNSRSTSPSFPSAP